MKADIFKYYEKEYIEDQRLIKDKAHQIEFLTTMRYFDAVLPKGSRVLDACAGTGAYAFYLAEQGHRVTAGDLVPHNVSIMEEKQSRRPVLEAVYTGTILDLSRFEANSFDVVLCMGALYHLAEEHDREKAVTECLRVLKPGGIFAAAYINKYAALLYDFKENLVNMEDILNYDQLRHGYMFQGTTPKEINEMMTKAGLQGLHHLGTDGISPVLAAKINGASEENFIKWLEYHYRSCEEESILGYSLHALYIGRKI